LRSSQSLVGCRRIVCYDAGCSDTAGLDAMLTATSSLMLSNDVRRDVCSIVCFGVMRGGECLRYRLVFYGARVKGLRMDENTVLGVLRSIMRRGSWPGVRVERIGPGSPCCGDCVGVEELLEGGGCGCVDVTGSLPGFGLKAWWLAAVSMVVCDGGEGKG
jgi:hypothetical protein